MEIRRPAASTSSVFAAVLLLSGCGGGDGAVTENGGDVDASSIPHDAGGSGADHPDAATEVDAGGEPECGDAEDCDDGLQCTVGSCEAGGACAFEPSDALCDDGDACTVNTCDTGQGCQSVARDCDDGNECTANSCDASQGCQATDVTDGTECAAGTGTCEDGACRGAEADVTGFRLDSLELQHPHIIIDTQILITICEDITFEPVTFFGSEIVPGVNPSLAELVADLELNLVQLLDPFRQDDELQGQSAVFQAECESETECAPEEDGLIVAAAHTVQRTGTCLADVPGLFTEAWPDGRTTEINSPEAGDHGCFATEPQDLVLEVELGGEVVELPLLDAQISGRFGAEPAARIEDGVIVGFLTQDAADEIEIEVDGREFILGEDLLPNAGENGDCELRSHCAGPDARTMHDDDCGWWFVFNVTGQRLADVDAFP